MGYVPEGNLLPLYNNAQPGIEASSSSLRDAVQAMALTVNENFDAAQNTNEGFSQHKLQPVLDHEDGSVTASKLRDLNVTTPKYANESITTPKIAPKAVDGTRIKDGAVSSQQLDPALLQNYGDIAVQAKFQQVDMKISDIVYKIINLNPDPTFDNLPTLQQALNKYPVVELPSGEYRIGVSGLEIPSNRTIIMQENTILKALPHNQGQYNLFAITTKKNVKIVGGVIDGNRQENESASGESGHGLGIRSSKNVEIYGTKIINCWGDGIYIGATGEVRICEDLRFDNIICDNNRRQGVSLITGKNITFNNPILKNTNGTAPQSGFCIEPNDNLGLLENIKVNEIYTENNAGSGITISLSHYGGGKSVSITITNHVDLGSEIGEYFNGSSAQGIGGKIQFVDSLCELNKSNGIYFRRYSSSFPRVDHVRPMIINCNSRGSTGDLYISGLLIFTKEDDTVHGDTGNIHVYNPSIIDNRSTKLMSYAIMALNYATGRVIENISIIDPIRLDSGLTRQLWWSVRDGVFVDSKKVATRNLDATVVLTPQNYTRYISNRNATSNRFITLSSPDLKRGSRATFIVESSFYLTIRGDASTSILPSGALNGKYIRSNTRGSSLTIEKVDDTTYYIVEMIGSWEVEA